MTLKLNGSTGGSVSIDAPAATTGNADITFSLPVADGSNGQVLQTNGSGQLSFASASSDNITEGNTSVEVVDTGSNGEVRFTTEGTRAATIDSSRRLLIGTTATDNFTNASLQVVANPYEAATLTNYIDDPYGPTLFFCKSRGTLNNQGLVSSGNEAGTISFTASDGTGFKNVARIGSITDGTPSAGSMPGRLFFATVPSGSTSNVERARFTSAGYFKASNTGGYLSTTSTQHEFSNNASSNAAVAVAITSTSYTSSVLYITCSTNTSNGQYNLIEARNGSGSARFVVLDSGNVLNVNNSYGALSDLKLKENIVDAKSQWDDIKALRVVNYNFKPETGAESFKQLGLIAQEVEQVCPGLVSETKDKETVEIPVLDADGKPSLDEDGKPQVTTEEREIGEVTKSVNYSVLYMKAVKALQEAMERIETLEAANVALEARLTALEGGTN